MTLAVGPSKYQPGGYIAFGRYASGELAIQIIAENGEMQAKATVSLIPYGAPDPGEHGVWLKDWSENEGIADALVRSGIVKLTGKTFPINFVVAKHAALTPAAIAAIPEGAQP